jgi:probable rRNA maturation factor
MLSLEFNKRVSCPWNIKEIKRIFKYIKKSTGISGEVEVNIVGDKEIKDLNFHYRGLNKPTDVLSFAWQEDGIIKSKSLGQIYISYPQIVRQAKELSVNPKEEFVRMLAHGFLHIIGHDHGKKKEAEIMFGIQEEIVENYLKA